MGGVPVNSTTSSSTREILNRIKYLEIWNKFAIRTKTSRMTQASGFKTQPY